MRRSYLVAIVLLVMLIYAAGMTLIPDLASPKLSGGDASYYQGTALELLRHGTYSQAPSAIWGLTIWRPPGYSLWLAGIYALFGAQPLVARLAQTGLHCVSLPLLYLLTLRLTHDRRAAGATALAYLLYLPALISARMHASEAVSAPLAIAAIWAAVEARERPTLARWALAGLLIGMGALVRPQSVLLLLVPLGFLLCDSAKPRERVGYGFVCLLAFGLVLGPWLAYTIRLVGHPSLGLSGCAEWISAEHYAGRLSYRWSSKDWARLEKDWNQRIRQGVEQADPNSPLPPQLQAELTTDNEWKAEARNIMRDVPLAKIASDVPVRLYYLWGPGAPGLLARVQWVLYAFLISAGAWIARTRWRAWWPLWVPAVLLCMAHLGLVIEPRYTFPLRPLLLVYLGVAVSALIYRTTPQLATKA